MSISDEMKQLASEIAQHTAEAVTQKLLDHYPVQKAADLLCQQDPARYHADHEWVKAMRDKAQERARFWEQMTLHVAKWGMISVLSVLFYGLWLALRQGLIK